MMVSIFAIASIDERWEMESGNRKSEIGNLKSESGNRKSERGKWKSEIGFYDIRLYDNLIIEKTLDYRRKTLYVVLRTYYFIHWT
jgi:hypothetical protein